MALSFLYFAFFRLFAGRVAVLKNDRISLERGRPPRAPHIGGPEFDTVRNRFMAELGILDRPEGIAAEVALDPDR